MNNMDIVEVPIPICTLTKLMVISDRDKISVAHIASQAVQEWVQHNYGKRVPGDP